MSYPTNNQQYVNFQGTQQPNQQQPKKNYTKNFLKIFTVGIFEILLVIIILGVFFGILNYFNIINLPKIYAPLNALPKIQPTPIPSPQPTPFVYNKNAAGVLISQYATQILGPQYEFTINKSNPDSVEQQNNVFTYTWSLDNKTTARGKIFNKINANDYDYLQLSVDSASTSAFPQDATSSAQQILSSFFKPYTGTAPLSCIKSNGNQICEQFSTTPIGDIGQGILWNKNNTYLLFACQIYPNSVYHQVKKSCLPLL